MQLAIGPYTLLMNDLVTILSNFRALLYMAAHPGPDLSLGSGPKPSSDLLGLQGIEDDERVGSQVTIVKTDSLARPTQLGK